MYKLLLIDDEAEIRKAIVNIINFKELGFDLIGEASNGLEALDIIEKNPPDLILTDIKMSYMDGIELAKIVNDNYPSIVMAFLSGYDDFEYARTAIKYNVISYMLKPISSKELNIELFNIKNKLDERKASLLDLPQLAYENKIKQLTDINTLLPLLVDSTKTITPKNVQLVRNAIIKFHNKEYFTVLVSEFDSNNYTEAEYVNAIDSLSSKYFSQYSFAYDGHILTIIAGTTFEINTYTKILVLDIIENTKKILNCEINIGISDMLPIEKINIAYSESKVALDYAKGTNYGFAFIKDIERGDLSDYNFLIELGYKIDNSLKIDTKQNFILYMNEALDYAIRIGIDVKLFCMQLYVAVCRCIASITDKKIPKEISDMFDSIITNISISEAKLSIINLAMKVKDYVIDLRKDSVNVISDKALKMIEDSFSDPNFSLTVLSEKLNCSVPYLSTIIKKNLGESFINILTKKRMEKALEFIKYTDMKMMDITIKCGYIDQHYFSYCFRRYYGISPLKMRSTVEIK